MIYLIAILPGLIVGYALFLRPVLHALPQLKNFYAEADGFWQKAWALSGKSATIVWGFALSGLGTVFQWLDPIAAALGDPDLKAQVMETLKDNPQFLAYALMGISAITIAARLRSFAKAAS